MTSPSHAVRDSSQEFSSPGLLAPELMQIRHKGGRGERSHRDSMCGLGELESQKKKKKTVWVVRPARSPPRPRRGLEETIPVVQVLCLSPQPRVVTAQNMPLNLCGSLWTCVQEGADGGVSGFAGMQPHFRQLSRE